MNIQNEFELIVILNKISTLKTKKARIELFKELTKAASIYNLRALVTLLETYNLPVSTIKLPQINTMIQHKTVEVLRQYFPEYIDKPIEVTQGHYKVFTNTYCMKKLVPWMYFLSFRINTKVKE